MIGDRLVCHTGIIPFPMRKGWDRVHRLVVLPDYQGIGIGTKFIKAVADLREKEGRRVNLTTTTPSLVFALAKDDDWALVRKGRSKAGWKNGNSGFTETHLAGAASDRRITYSFNYQPKR